MSPVCGPVGVVHTVQDLHQVRVLQPRAVPQETSDVSRQKIRVEPEMRALSKQHKRNSRYLITMQATRNSQSINPRPLGYSAERAPLGGDFAPPLANSKTRGRNEVGDAANESSR